MRSRTRVGHDAAAGEEDVLVVAEGEVVERVAPELLDDASRPLQVGGAIGGAELGAATCPRGEEGEQHHGPDGEGDDVASEALGAIEGHRQRRREHEGGDGERDGPHRPAPVPGRDDAEVPGLEQEPHAQGGRQHRLLPVEAAQHLGEGHHGHDHQRGDVRRAVPAPQRAGQSDHGEAAEDGQHAGRPGHVQGHDPLHGVEALAQGRQERRDHVDDAGGDEQQRGDAANATAPHPRPQSTRIGRPRGAAGQRRHHLWRDRDVGHRLGHETLEDRARGDGRVAHDEADLEDVVGRQLDPGAPPEPEERPGQPEPGRVGADGHHPAAGVGVEPRAHHRQLRVVGVTRDHAGVPARDHPPGALAGGGVVAGGAGVGGELLGQRVVDAQHRERRGHGGHEQDEHERQPESHQPALRVVGQQPVHPG